MHSMTPDEHFEAIAEDLAPLGATAGVLFGKRILKAHGKTFACLKDGWLAIKLGEGTAAHSEALGLAGAELFDPSGKDRPFRDWVAVPEAQAAEWPRLAEAAFKALTG